MKNKFKDSKSTMNFIYRYGVLIVMSTIILYFSITLDNFMSFRNITNIFRSVAIVSMIAMAITVSLTINGFDLSIGAIAGFASVIAAKTMVIWEMHPIFAIIIPLLTGVLIGSINAFFIVKVGIVDMLATLSMMFLLTGVSITFQNGTAIYNYMPLPGGGVAQGLMHPSYLYLGQDIILGIPVPVIIMFIIAIILHVFLKYTKHGRRMYMIGGNAEAARFSGINVERYKFAAYIISAVIASIGGLILGARIGSGEVNAGAPFLMDSVAAAFIGFSLLGAGKPNPFGTLAGALLMGILLNGLIMMNFPYYSQDIVKGIVLIFALSLTYYIKKRSIHG